MTDQHDDNSTGAGGESMPPDVPVAIRHYFVDEAGDGTLFSKHGRSLVGTEGCSRYFFLGLLDVLDPRSLDVQLGVLRTALLADPYLQKIPSMHPEKRKTAVAFHAKDDCPEVRREVFRLLVQQDVRFFAVVRDKEVIFRKVLEQNSKTPKYRYHPNQLYDRCVARLFRDRLHKDGSYAVYFSKRGSSNRTEAMQKALEQARANFRHKFQRESTAPIEILAAVPALSPGLQAVDYFLWALQRIYEHREDRYWEFVAEKVSLVHDVDDTRTADYGEYYPKRNPLTLERLPRKD